MTVTGVDADLATLRESSGMLADLAEAAGCNSVDVDETRAPLIEALARVEAELASVREERDALREALTAVRDCAKWTLAKAVATAEAAERALSEIEAKPYRAEEVIARRRAGLSASPEGEPAPQEPQP